MGNGFISVFNRSFHYNQIGYIASVIEPLHINSDLNYIKSEFEKNDYIEAIPIESDTGIVGLISRKTFLSSVKSKIETFLHGDLEHYMVMRPLILDARTNCENAFRQIFKDISSESVEEFLVYHKSRYFGILSVRTLIKHILYLRDSELLSAKKIQSSLICKDVIETSNFWAGVKIRMARELGGDFFQIRSIRDDYHLISCFDVCGKGVSASLYTTIIGSYFSTLEEIGLLKEKNPVDIIQMLHNVIRKNSETGNFIACVFFFIDSANDEIEIYNLGFSPVYICQKNEEDKNTIIVKNPQYPPLGLDEFELSDGEKITIRLTNSLSLFACSDGLMDMQNIVGDPYGDDNVLNFVQRNFKLRKAEYLAKLMKEADIYMESTPLVDDITAVFIDCRGNELNGK